MNEASEFEPPPLSALEGIADTLCRRITGHTYEDIRDEPLWGASLSSLTAVQLIAEIFDQAAISVSGEVLQRATTLRGILISASFGKAAQQHSAEEQGPLARLANRYSYVLRRQEALEQWVCCSPLLRPRERLDRQRWQDAVAALVAYHPGLRLQARLRDGNLEESILPASSIDPVVTIDLPATTDERHHQQMAISAAAEIAGSFTFPGPLFRTVVLRSRGRPDMVVVLIHHLLVDTYSLGLIWHDLENLYFLGSTLPAPTSSLSDYAVLSSRHWGAQARYDLGYWASLPWFETEPVVGGTGQPDGSLFGTEGETRQGERDLGSATSLSPHNAWTEVSRPFRAAMAILSAAALAYHKCTGQPLLLIDVIFHGRAALIPGLNLTRTVGYISEAVPMLLPADGSPTGQASLEEQLLNGFARGGSHNYLRHSAAADLRGIAATWPQAQISINIVLPGLRKAVLPNFADAVGPPCPVPGAQRAHRVYAISGGLFVRNERLILSWDWGPAVSEYLMVRFLDSCQQLFQQQIDGSDS